jgi:hypothetical protein
MLHILDKLVLFQKMRAQHRQDIDCFVNLMKKEIPSINYFKQLALVFVSQDLVSES